jgi:carboxyl-terminal processing protease
MRFGSELAQDISGLKAKGVNRLVIDLRGNIGGSLGFAILASYLCPGEQPIGYSITPRTLRNGYSKEKLPRVRMPRNNIELMMTMSNYAFRDKSVVLMTQGLGPQPFHGNVVILINEFTHSAGEMIASFAAENGLALLVGTKTTGNALGAANFHVGYNYFLRVPIFGWFNWSGKYLEGAGVTPDVSVDRDTRNCADGGDQFQTALSLLA